MNSDDLNENYPSLDVQKSYWDSKWEISNLRYPHDRAYRRGSKILEFLCGLELRNPSIMDLGCGTGWFSKELAKYGPTWGLDLSDETIRKAQTDYPSVKFISGDAYRLEEFEKSFDIVVSQEVLAHVPNQKAYLEVVHRLLKPRGYLILTTPNKFVHERHTWPDQDAGHIEHWLTKSQLRKLLAMNFRVLKQCTVVPLGNKGVMRVVNSSRLTRAFQSVLGTERVEVIKESLGFGWTQVVLARKWE